ncbi:F-box/kelch-repeat protein At3g23880-like [Bidens hawaiensis]|uniref:F-box/kelch-repeat protein At3g23880-like n=1 Tax=Bidens hawaiensis TaxID=980011 RepID=UPI004049B235
MIGSSHGLVCLSGVGTDLPNNLIVVWNPSIRKSVGVMSPSGTNIAGFGLCPKTNDPKIIALTSDQEAEVFTLSTKTWRSVPMNMFHTLIGFRPKQVVIDGVIHWSATIYDPDDVEYRTIVSFDLSSEEFGEIALPDPLGPFGVGVEVCKLKESLALIHYPDEHDAGILVYDVRVTLKNGVSKYSFTKLFTVKDKPSIGCITGFSMNGQPVIELIVGSRKKELEVYEPNSEDMNSLGIYGSDFYMVNYRESLLLLDHSDSIILP